VARPLPPRLLVIGADVNVDVELGKPDVLCGKPDVAELGKPDAAVVDAKPDD
jgi:hypothetical protein